MTLGMRRMQSQKHSRQLHTLPARPSRWNPAPYQVAFLGRVVLAVSHHSQALVGICGRVWSGGHSSGGKERIRTRKGTEVELRGMIHRIDNVHSFMSGNPKPLPSPGFCLRPWEQASSHCGGITSPPVFLYPCLHARIHVHVCVPDLAKCLQCIQRYLSMEICLHVSTLVSVCVGVCLRKRASLWFERGDCRYFRSQCLHIRRRQPEDVGCIELGTCRRLTASAGFPAEPMSWRGFNLILCALTAGLGLVRCRLSAMPSSPARIA